MNRILSIEKLDRYGRAAESAEEESSGYTSAGSRGRFARVRVTPEEGEPFTISGRTADRLGLAEGGELSGEVYAEILQSLRASCLQRCGTLLGSRDYPEARLQKKLQEAGFPPVIIEECMGKLKEAHYLDDRRYAQSYVRSHLQDRSSLRIRMDLKDRGIPEELIDEAFEELAGEIDPRQAQLDQIRRLLRKRGYEPGRDDYTQRQKTMAFLHRKGYEPELIRRAMEEE